MKKAPLLFSIVALISFSTSALAANGVYPLRNRITPKGVGSKVRAEEGPEAAKPKLLYYGGPIIASAKVVSVFWGAAVDPIVQQKIGGFYAAVLNSTQMDFLKQYSTTQLKAVDGREGTNQTLGRGSYLGEVKMTPFRTGKDLDDLDIQAEIEQQIGAGVLPKPDANTLYMIHFPAGVNIAIDGMKSCTSFCAYHMGMNSKTYGNIFYGVIPDFRTGACSFGCGMEKDAFDTTTVISSHELLEAITDPFPTPGDKPAFPQAWNTFDGEEIADLCTSGSGQLKTQGVTYLLHREFDNATQSCVTGPYQNP